MDRPMREPSERLAGPNRHVYVAGVLALTEPGPAAAGIVVTDERARTLAHRAHYLGSTNRTEATAQALLAAMRLAQAGGMEAPTFYLDDSALAEALTDERPLPDGASGLADAIREAREALPGHHLETVSPAVNLARPVALAPLIEWLPERTRRAEGLAVQKVGDDAYEVASERNPDQVYRITLPRPGSPPTEALQCECADFQYRGIPCKHLLAVARQSGQLEQLFHRERGPSAAGARGEGG